MQPKKLSQDIEVIFLDEYSINDWLPKIDPRILHIRNLAHKADCLRALLLREHGGFWLDPDAILLNILPLTTDKLVGFSESGDLSTLVKIGFLGAPANHPAICEWVDSQARSLGKQKFNWTELGATKLTPACASHSDKCHILSDKLIEPIHWKHPHIFQEDVQVEKIVTSELLAIMLYFSRGEKFYRLNDNTLIKRLVERF